MIWRPEIRHQSHCTKVKVSEDWFLLGALGKYPFPFLSWRPHAFLGWWPLPCTLLGLLASIVPSPLCYQIPLCLFKIKTFRMTSRIFLPSQDPIFNPICKIPLTMEGNIHRFQWLGLRYLWGHYSVYHTYLFWPHPFQTPLKHFLSAGNFPFLLLPPISTSNYPPTGYLTKVINCMGLSGT